MSMRDELKAKLAALAGVVGPQSLEITDGGSRLLAELDECDRLACAVRRFTLHTDRLANADVARLRKLSEALTSRLTYLLEPIGAVEIDADSCTLQMRSTQPQKDDDGTSYYELLVRRGGEIGLLRYAKAPGQSRRVISAHLTHEVLLRLVADFAAVAVA
ncbi:MAG: hypothetical protein U0836_16010 [Pirellulales bacterium]